MSEQVAKNVMPGAVWLIARNGKIVNFEAVGFLDNGKTKPMGKDAVFRAFSMTKPFTSVAAMMMIEQGKFQLRDPISNYLPELKDLKVIVEKRDAAGNVTKSMEPARPVTVQDLLRHSTGFVYSAAAPFPEVKAAYERLNIEQRDADLSPDDFMRNLGQIPLIAQPGTTFFYSISTDVLGVLLERASGKMLHVLLDEMIFKPLKMTNTSFQATAAQLPILADAFDADSLKLSLWKGARVETDPAKRYRLGGAGTVTTAMDYFRFSQMMLNGGEFEGARLLSRKTVELMLSDHSIGFAGNTNASTGPGYGFGLGFAVRRQDGMGVAPGSTGDAMWAGAGGTSFTIDPKEKIVGVLMTASPSNRVHTRMLFKNMLYGALVQ